MAIVAIAVRIDSRGSSFYRQKRIGQGGVPFSLIKFRTMVHDARGSMLTGPGDARVTRIGHFLRAVAIDELPQLLNVLAGHMTLVGPRPQTPGFAARYPEELREVFVYRPGIVGPGVLRLNDDDVLPEGMDDLESWYLTNVIPARVKLDLEYLRDPTIRRTFRIILDTLIRVPKRFIAQPAPPQLVVLDLTDTYWSDTGNEAVERKADDPSDQIPVQARESVRHGGAAHLVLALHEDEVGALTLRGRHEVHAKVEDTVSAGPGDSIGTREE
jgi:lipopolysaccharide/colanic/teichoic acid biosynthesis glycosyltransferase